MKQKKNKTIKGYGVFNNDFLVRDKGQFYIFEKKSLAKRETKDERFFFKVKKVEIKIL